MLFMLFEINYNDTLAKLMPDTMS